MIPVILVAFAIVILFTFAHLMSKTGETKKPQPQPITPPSSDPNSPQTPTQK